MLIYLISNLLQGPIFPELTKKPEEVKELLDEEEVSFARTLDRGEKLFDQYAEKARERGEKTLNGKDVWRLYDTYGFPVDLTRLMAEELGLHINETEFEEAQAASKEASKGLQKKQTGTVVKLDVHDIAALEKDMSIPKTNDSDKFRALAYSLTYSRWLIRGKVVGNSNSTIKGIYYDRAFFKSTAEFGEDSAFGLLLDRTSFYAESGGQEYDTGNIVIDGIADFEVTNVQVFNGYVLHIGHLKYGQFSVGDDVICSYDEVSIVMTDTYKRLRLIIPLIHSSAVGLCVITILRPTF
jgi:alanyl-tRNA synthetase